MKKAAATYGLGLVLGSVLGFGSLAAAGSTFSVNPTRYETFSKRGHCSTSGGTAKWSAESDWLSNDSKMGDMTVVCRNLATESGGPGEVRKLVLEVSDTGEDIKDRVQARTECSGPGVTHKSLYKSTPAADYHSQRISFSKPWLAGCTTSLVRVFLPRYGDWYETAITTFKVTYY